MNRRKFLDLTRCLFAKHKVLIIGDSMLDVYYEYDNYDKSPEGNHPKLSNRINTTSMGGTSNIARIIKGLKGRTRMITTTGKQLIRTKGFENFIYQVHDLDADIDVIGIDSPVSVKVRHMHKDEILFRVDFDHFKHFPWFEFSKGEDIFCFDPDIVLIQDYGKGLVNNTMLTFLEALVERCNPYIIFGPHITTRKFKLKPHAMRMNFKEYKKFGGSPEAIARDFGVQDILIVTNAQGIEGFINFPEWTHFTIRNNAAVRNPNVVGAGDIIMGILGKIDWRMFITERVQTLWDIVELAMNIATLKCSKWDLEISIKSLFKEFYNEHCSQECLLHDIESFYSDIEIESNLNNEIILMNGCFDKLHPGHFRLFGVAQDHKINGSKIVIALNSDESCMERKGKKPTFPLEDRMLQLQNLGFVDYIVVFDTEEELDDICKICNPIMIKGSDYDGKSITGKDHCSRIEFVDVYGGYHSSTLGGDIG